jgi:hypothetical protein
LARQRGWRVTRITEVLSFRDPFVSLRDWLLTLIPTVLSPRDTFVSLRD